MATQEQLLGAILSAMTGTTGHGGTAEQSLEGILSEVTADGNMPPANLLALKTELPILPTAAVIASQLGKRLIASLQVVWPSNAGTAHFSTTKATAGAVTLKTSTGYARLINADGTLGTQAGTGSPTSFITLTFAASGGHRALGVVSVANTEAVQSGAITVFFLNSNQITSFSGAGLASLINLNLSNNQLTSFSGSGISNLVSLTLDYNQLTSFSGAGLTNLNNITLTNNQLTSFSVAGLSNLNNLGLDSNQLTTSGQDAVFNSLSVSAETNGGEWNSPSNLGAPSAASATKRAAMIAGGWTIAF